MTQTLYRCCVPDCPGYPYPASQMRHPCQETAPGNPPPEGPDPAENRATGDPGASPLQSPQFCTWCLAREGTFTWIELPDVNFRRCLCRGCLAAVSDAVVAVAIDRRRERWEVGS